MKKFPKDLNIHSITISSDNRDVLKVVKRIKDGHLILNPSSYWGNDKKSSFIESMLLRIPLGYFYICDPTMTMGSRVLDGTKRLNAIMEFYDNSFALEGVVPELEGKTYDTLSTQLKRRIEDTSLSIYRVPSDIPEEIRFAIYERVN